MPGARLPMRKIRDMLGLTAAGMSSRKIAASLSIGGTTVVDWREAVARIAGELAAFQARPWWPRLATGFSPVLNGTGLDEAHLAVR